MIYSSTMENDLLERGKFGFLKRRHVNYFRRCIDTLPSYVASLDTSRMTVLFFAVSGLDVTNSLHELNCQQKNLIVDWIYSLQVLPLGKGKYEGGFRGGSHVTPPYGCDRECILDTGHIAMTYTALATLLVLNDSLERVNRPAVLAHVRSLQCLDGSYSSTLGGSENDMRFVYCAAAVCHILSDFSAMDVESAVKYIVNSMTYEGALGQSCHLESHGGSTFCGVAALHLMGRLEDALSMSQRMRLIRWLLNRQDHEGGLQGRPNKPPDTCYTFWVGATLQLLDCAELLQLERLRQFVLSVQDPITGGLAKYQDAMPDVMHTYLALSGLALLTRESCGKVDGADGQFGQEEVPRRARGIIGTGRLEDDELLQVEPSLNITMRASQHLFTIQQRWKREGRRNDCFVGNGIQF